jgi:hypothetical protein
MRQDYPAIMIQEQDRVDVSRKDAKAPRRKPGFFAMLRGLTNATNICFTAARHPELEDQSQSMKTRFAELTDEELELLLDACKEHWFAFEVEEIQALGEELRIEINLRGGVLPKIDWSDWATPKE